MRKYYLWFVNYTDEDGFIITKRFTNYDEAYQYYLSINNIPMCSKYIDVEIKQDYEEEILYLKQLLSEAEKHAENNLTNCNHNYFHNGENSDYTFKRCVKCGTIIYKNKYKEDDLMR